LFAYAIRFPGRTLQRRLQTLVAAGRVRSQGGSRSLVYRLVLPDDPSILAQTSTPYGEEGPAAYVPLSAAGLEVRDGVRRPLMSRPPVGYQHEFLERYRPNHDFYLSGHDRRQLHESGRTPGMAGPAGTYARDILGRLLIDLSWASSRLEGNTYTRLDTQRLIELGLAAPGKPAQETQMILNHKAAIEMLVEGADEIAFDRYTVLNLHAILSENLMPDPLASGRLRKRAVCIGGTAYMPLVVPQQIAECFDHVLRKASRIEDPFEQAFFCMVHLPYLQPFEDVNKRVSRLCTNIPLIRQNLCPLSFVDVPGPAYVEALLGVYEANRVELLRDVFMWAYQRSCQRYLAIRSSVGEPDAFRVKYRAALKQMVHDVVRNKRQGAPAEIESMARGLVATHDIAAAVEAVQSDLNHLYQGNIARFRLRLSDYVEWPFKRSTDR
jgi:hypothetical protein